MKPIVIYSTHLCPRCKILARFLKGLGYDFDEIDLESRDKIYTTRDLFDEHDRLMEDKVLLYLEKAYVKHD